MIGDAMSSAAKPKHASLRSRPLSCPAGILSRKGRGEEFVRLRSANTAFISGMQACAMNYAHNPTHICGLTRTEPSQ